MGSDWDRVAGGPFKALHHGQMVGIGAAMEGMVGYPTFQLLFDMAWCRQEADIDKWTARYALQRYGRSNKLAHRAWELLKESVYDTRAFTQHSCVFCNCPDGLSWASAIGRNPKPFPYDQGRFVSAWRSLLDAADSFQTISTYRFDVTDVTRQVLDNLGLWQYGRMMEAHKKKLPAEFEKQSRIFLNMILDEDRLLNTQEGFLLGRWIADARRLSRSVDEKLLLEHNARTLLTVWGPRPGLADYAAREWAGMLRSFYFPRWNLWVREQRNILKGQAASPVSYFDWALNWTTGKTEFSPKPFGDSIIEARRIVNKYRSMLKEAGQWI